MSRSSVPRAASSPSMRASAVLARASRSRARSAFAVTSASRAWAASTLASKVSRAASTSALSAVRTSSSAARVACCARTSPPSRLGDGGGGSFGLLSGGSVGLLGGGRRHRRSHHGGDGEGDDEGDDERRRPGSQHRGPLGEAQHGAPPRGPGGAPGSGVEERHHRGNGARGGRLERRLVTVGVGNITGGRVVASPRDRSSFRPSCRHVLLAARLRVLHPVEAGPRRCRRHPRRAQHLGGPRGRRLRPLRRPGERDGPPPWSWPVRRWSTPPADEGGRPPRLRPGPHRGSPVGRRPGQR